ncbi:gamma-glutamyltransferase [Paraburkholderia sp. MPAMCS5]|nr:gamma-glutamyltransferase [Paraburkholderia sp. MPAMCS5]
MFAACSATFWDERQQVRCSSGPTQNLIPPVVVHDRAPSRCEVQTPIDIRYRGFEVRQTPPNSTGFAHLVALKILERFDLSELGYLSADTLHLLVEAKKLAFAVRERYASDPRRRPVPVDELLDERFIDALIARIDRKRAASIDLREAWQAASSVTTARRHAGNTTYFCTIDGEGNAVSAIQSLNNAFGSAVTLGGTGVLLNNRMTCWHLDADHPNALAADTRVRQTMNAPIVLRDGRISTCPICLASRHQ